MEGDGEEGEGEPRDTSRVLAVCRGRTMVLTSLGDELTPVSARIAPAPDSSSSGTRPDSSGARRLWRGIASAAAAGAQTVVTAVPLLPRALFGGGEERAGDADSAAAAAAAAAVGCSPLRLVLPPHPHAVLLNTRYLFHDPAVALPLLRHLRKLARGDGGSGVGGGARRPRDDSDHRRGRPPPPPPPHAHGDLVELFLGPLRLLREQFHARRHATDAPADVDRSVVRWDATAAGTGAAAAAAADASPPPCPHDTAHPAPTPFIRWAYFLAALTDRIGPGPDNDAAQSLQNLLEDLAAAVEGIEALTAWASPPVTRAVLLTLLATFPVAVAVPQQFLYVGPLVALLLVRTTWAQLVLDVAQGCASYAFGSRVRRQRQRGREEEDQAVVAARLATYDVVADVVVGVD
jgi:hypothetical protein